MPPKPRPLMDRFNEKVDRSGGPDACWPWTKARNEAGYGVIRVGGRNRRAHRVAVFGEDDPGPDVKVRHSCDNPPCCNPAHLLPGTAAQNVADMDERGRRVKPYRIYPNQRKELVTEWSEGKTTTELSRKYKVTVATILKITAGVPGGRAVLCIRGHDQTMPGATREYVDPSGVVRHRCVLCRRAWSNHYNRLRRAKEEKN